MPREWDGGVYDRIADPMTRWGATVLDRLPLSGDEIVLDAGCGTGRVTEQLLQRLPRGRVIALDASASMLDKARERLATTGDRVEFVQANLSEPLPLGELVDAIISTATFHWVPDHDALFANLAAVMRPGGRLVAQCGGKGNLDEVMTVLDGLAGSAYRPWTFASAEETEARLAKAGFVGIETWLNDEPTVIPAEDFETYLAEVILGANLAKMPEADRAPFVRAVASRLPEHTLDYVRLNIIATRG